MDREEVYAGVQKIANRMATPALARKLAALDPVEDYSKNGVPIAGCMALPHLFEALRLPMIRQLAKLEYQSKCQERITGG